MKKQNLPSKICLVCKRPFNWRKTGKKLNIVAKDASEAKRKSKETRSEFTKNDLHQKGK